MKFSICRPEPGKIVSPDTGQHRRLRFVIGKQGAEITKVRETALGEAKGPKEVLKSPLEVGGRLVWSWVGWFAGRSKISRTRAIALFLATFALTRVGNVSAAAIYWTNTAGGNWSVPANWSPNQVPGASDNAFIVSNGTYTVLIDANAAVGALTVGGTSGTQTVGNSTYTLTLNGSSTFSTNGILSLNGGTIGGGGLLTVNGGLNVSAAGSLAGSGMVDVNGALTVAGSGAIDGRTLNNSGTVGLTNSTLYLKNGAIFTNEPGGLLVLTSGNLNNSTGPLGAVYNAGTVHSTGNSAFLYLPFYNSGTVEAQSGYLTVQNGIQGIHTGSFACDGGATLELDGYISGTNILAAGSSVTGAGTVSFGRGETDINGTYNVTGTSGVNFGTVNFNPGCSIVSLGTNVAVGTGSYGGTMNLNSGNSVVLGGLSITNGLLSGNDPITVNGPLILTSTGTIGGSGVIYANSGLTVSANCTLDGRTLINSGAATVTGGFGLSHTAIFSNLVGATLTLTTGTVNGSSATAALFNAGSLRSTGTSGFSLIFCNSGSVEAQSGYLTIENPTQGTHTGSFLCDAGATLEFDGYISGTNILAAGSSITGAGTVIFGRSETDINGTYNVTGASGVNWGPANFNPGCNIVNMGALVTVGFGPYGGTLSLASGSALTLATLNITNGLLTGSDPITVSGPLNLTSQGIIGGSGVIYVNGGMTVGGPYCGLDGRTLINSGVATITSSTLDFYHTAIFSNLVGATLTLSNGTISGQNAGAASRVYNAGVVQSARTSSFFLIDFFNSGSVSVQNGTLTIQVPVQGIHSGSFSCPAGATLNFNGYISGTNTLTGSSSVTCAGTLMFGRGETDINGTYNVSGTSWADGGTINFNPGCRIVNIGANLLIGTEVNFPATVAFNTGTAVLVPTLTLTNGTLAGSDTVTVTGPLNLSVPGAIGGSGIMNANGGLTIAGGFTSRVSLDGRTFNNSGAATLVGRFFIGYGGIFNNLSGATFTVSAGNIEADPGAPAAFDNAGTFKKTTDTNATLVDVAFNNSGTVQVLTGTLDLDNGGTSSGTFSVPSGSKLIFAGGQIFTPTASVTGAGTFTVPSGTFTNAGTYNISGGTTIGPTAGSTGAVTIATGTFIATNAPVLIGPGGGGLMTISGGDVTLGQVKLGGTTTNASGELDLLGGGHLTILSNASANLIVINGGDLDGSGGTIIIGQDHSANMVVAGGACTNVGTMDVGYSAGFTGTLTESGGVASVTQNLIVGDCVTNSTGVVSLSGGELYVTNATHTAVLDVRQGSFLLNGGTLVVDILRVTNACGGTFTHAGGSLIYQQLQQAGGGGVSAVTNLVLDGGAGAGLGAGTFGGPSVLYVTNSSHNAVFNVLNGAFVLGAGGTLVVDDLILTNANGHFYKTGGTLQAHGMVLDPNLDADGDGQSNTNEIRAGTDPLDPTSLFQTLSGVVTNGTDVVVSWTTEGGHSYVVQWAPALTGGPGAFRDLSKTIVVAGTGPGTTNYVHTGAATNQAGLYRVRLGP